MPRGRAAGYQTQRADILAQAAELFAEHGYTATSMNQVALACGISKPALYHYVRDKHQLLFEIAADHIARLEALTALAAARPVEAEQRLRSLIASFLEVYASARSEHRVLTEDVRFLAAAERERVLDGQRRVVAGFAAAIEATRPELGGSHLQTPLAMLLFGMMNWLHTWLKPDGALSHAQLAPIVADLYFGGLRAVRPPKPASLPDPRHGDAAPCS